MILLSNASATGSAVTWGGGQGVFSVAATFGGGNVALQALLPDGSSWGAVPLTTTAGQAATLAANGHGTFTLPPGSIRAAVTTATAVYAVAEQAHP
jgi:hypothetical protein